MSYQRDSRQGWVVAGSACLGLALSVGVFLVHSFGVLSSAMSADLGWGSVERSTIFAAFSVCGTISIPIWGVIVDRVGSRPVVLIALALMAAGFCALAVMPNSLFLACAIFAFISFVGGGAAPPSFTSAVVGWFERRRGLALGITITGIGVGAAVIPPVSAMIITEYGWRAACFVIAALVGLVSLPVQFMLLRPYPEAQVQGEVAVRQGNAQLGEAFRQRHYWVLVLVAFLTGVVVIGSVTNFVPLLQSRGETLVRAAQYQAALGISLIAGRLITGWLFDRVFAPRVMLVVLTVTALAFVLLYSAASPAAYIVGAIGIGLAVGAEVDFLAFMVSRYFDRARFATLFALLFFMFSVGGTCGPPALAWLERVSGSLSLGFLMFGVVTFLLALSTLMLPRYADQGRAE